MCMLVLPDVCSPLHTTGKLSQNEISMTDVGVFWRLVEEPVSSRSRQEGAGISVRWLGPVARPGGSAW